MIRRLFGVLGLTTFLWAADLSGTVVDARTGESIPGVNVIVPARNRGSASDLEGFFVLRDPGLGTVEIHLSHIAYRDTLFTLEVGPVDRYLGPIPLQPRSLETEAVEVTGIRNSIIQKNLDIGSFQADPILLTEIPQLGKDVFQLIRYSPSVTVSDPFSPQYYVRGSDPGENMVQLDGMTIYNPQHFLGSNAIFNPYAIKNIEMLVGGFDAEYGGRNASILNITTREGHQSEIHGEFRPSISGLRGAIEFPLGNGSTAMLSGRLLTDIMTRVMLGSPNSMMDFNGAWRFQLGRTNLRFSGFYARDYMDYSADNLFLFFPDTLFDSFEESFTTNTHNLALGLRASRLLQPTLLWEAHVYRSRSAVDNLTRFAYAADDTASEVDIALDFRTRIENSVDDRTLKTNLVWYAPLNQTFKVGLEWNHITFQNEQGRFRAERQVETQVADHQAFFVQDQVEVGALTLKAGLRMSRGSISAHGVMEPRASASLGLGPHRLKLALGTYYQYLTTMDTRGDEFVQFLEYYQSLGGREPIHSRQRILGLEGPLRKGLEYSISVYGKELDRLYRSLYQGSSDEAQIIAGRGRSYGAEFLIRGDWGPLSGWIGYTWSRGLRTYPQLSGDEEVLFDGDQPHNFKAVLLYKLTPVITASSTLQFTSGFPRTWETGQLLRYSYNPLDNSFGAFATTITPERNNVRYPPRLIWDLGWKKRLRGGFGFHLAEYLGGLDAIYVVTIRNLLFLHRDPVYYLFLPNYGYYGLDAEFLPSINAGYSIRF